MEPPQTDWEFPSPLGARDDLVAVGADLEPGTLLTAYRSGLFPMPIRRRVLGWWSPDPRGVLPVDGLLVSRSLRRSLRRYTVTVDADFEAVMRACGDPRREHGWITDAFVAAYLELHRLGWAHSVETWSAEGELVGGLYGVSIGGFFAGESMFHRSVDASKVALAHLVEALGAIDGALLDVQWRTEHLASLGVVEVDRPRYLELLGRALSAPPPLAFGGGRPAGPAGSVGRCDPDVVGLGDSEVGVVDVG